jgi:hypothetical protein
MFWASISHRVKKSSMFLLDAHVWVKNGKNLHRLIPNLLVLADRSKPVVSPQTLEFVDCTSQFALVKLHLRSVVGGKRVWIHWALSQNNSKLQLGSYNLQFMNTIDEKTFVNVNLNVNSYFLALLWIYVGSIIHKKFNCFDLHTMASSSSYSRQPTPSSLSRSSQPFHRTQTPFIIKWDRRWTWRKK